MRTREPFPAPSMCISDRSDAIVFGVLILVLLVKPTGILGKKMNEKV